MLDLRFAVGGWMGCWWLRVGCGLVRVVVWLGAYGVCLRVVLFRFADCALLCFGLL